MTNVLKDTRNTLTKHKESYPNDSRDIDNLINKIPKVIEIYEVAIRLSCRFDTK